MKCPQCGNTLITEDKIVAEYFFCDNCDYEEIRHCSAGQCCISPEVIPVRDYWEESEAFQNSDNYRVFNQCQHCGKRVGTAMKKKDFNKDDLPKAWMNSENAVKDAQNDLHIICKRINERKSLVNQTSFWNDYDEYLQSERWKAIKKIVFERDNYICQSCLYEKATEVHHTIGKFRKNEPLFSLISICSRCHNIITQIERGNYEKAEKIKYKFDP